MVEVQTTLTASALLARLQALEQRAGCQHSFHNAPPAQSKKLTIPLRRTDERASVLVPLAEIAPQSATAAQLQAVRAQCFSLLEKRHGVAGKR